MQKPAASTIPGMTDTLEFVKNLWGGMNVPGMGMSGVSAAPLSTEELDKKIADLRAVETWLNMNTTMLRGTIQALEVQRGTIATLKTMSANMAQAMGQAGEQAASMAPQFAQFFAQPGAAAAPAGHESKAQAQPQSAGQGSSQGGGAEPPAAAAGMPAAVAWWNMLQDQFTQAVTNAMSPDVMAGATAMAQNAARFAEATMPGAAAGAAKPGAAPDDEGGGGTAQPGAPKPKPPRAGDKS
jgi:hypothetical protein